MKRAAIVSFRLWRDDDDEDDDADDQVTINWKVAKSLSLLILLLFLCEAVIHSLFSRLLRC